MKTIEQVKEKLKWLKLNCKQISEDKIHVPGAMRAIFERDIKLYQELLDYIDSEDTNDS